MKNILASVLLAGIAVIAIAQDSGVKGLEGKPMPAFSMKTLEGKTLNNGNSKGKVVLLDFWATWCGPCKAASPSMQALHAKYAKQGLMVVGANTEGDGTEAVKKKLTDDYRKKHKYTYTFTYNNEDLSSKLGISGIPCFILVDKKGKVVKVVEGFGPAVTKELDTLIGKAVKG